MNTDGNNPENINTPQKVIYPPVTPVPIGKTLHEESIIKPWKQDDSPPVSVGNDKSTTNSPLVRISPRHGRATSESRSHLTIWGDIYGIHFGAVNYKGNNFENVHIAKDSTLGWRVNGLVTQNVLYRINHVSDFMRRNGLPTEVVNAAYRIDEIRENSSQLPMSVSEWKNWILTNWESDKGYVEVKKFVDTITNFFILERHLPMDVRVADLLEAKTEKNFLRLVDQPMKWFNQVLNLRTGEYRPWNPGQRLDLRDPDIREFYFSNWLPSQMGEYLGKMHNLGVASNYPHTQNWCMNGVLVDLDSFDGPGLGNEFNVQNKEEFSKNAENDVDTTIYVIMEMFLKVNPKLDRGIVAFEPDAQCFLRNDLCKKGLDVPIEAISNFLGCYIRTRLQGRDISKEEIKKYLTILSPIEIGETETPNFIDRCVDKIKDITSYH